MLQVRPMSGGNRSLVPGWVVEEHKKSPWCAADRTPGAVLAEFELPIMSRSSWNLPQGLEVCQ